ncbi:MAG: DUF2283 domain-containing protein [Dehalococcoidia bacterium]
MRVKYDREVDILTVEASTEPIAYAEELGSFIVHFSEGGKPVLLEILDASDFLTQAAKVALAAKDGGFVEIAI